MTRTVDPPSSFFNVARHFGAFLVLNAVRSDNKKNHCLSVIIMKTNNYWIFDEVNDQFFMIIERKTEDINRMKQLKKNIQGLCDHARSLCLEAKPQKMVETMAPTAQGTETILLVEDEPAILKLLTKLLKSQGYTVLPTLSSKEAIMISEEYTDTIHLLLTDVIMPEMNGRELSYSMLSRNPNLKCLFMSGYTADSIVQRGILEDEMDFLQKPFSKKDLLIRVQEVLNQKPINSN